MPQFTSIPSRDGLPPTELYTRISTPSAHDSDSIDPSLETLVFIHPLWTDSFFFYPQYEETVFAEHFNLVAFDMRGHGMTSGDLPEGVEYSRRDVACDIHDAMSTLNISKAHFIGAGSSTTAAAYLACLFPQSTLTTSLVAPNPREETPASAQVYDELLQILDVAVRERDADSLEHIVVSMFDFHLDYQLAPQLRGVRDEYVQIAKTRLAAPQIDANAKFTRSLIQTRQAMPSEAEMGALQCPVLIMTEDPRDTSEPSGYESVLFKINANHPASHPLAIEQHVEGPKWLTLASPNLVNPVLSAFLSTPPNQPRTPLTSSTLHSPRPMSRRPSTPREYTSFSIPALPPPKSGVLTMGDVLDMEAKRRAEEAGQKSPSVVNMTVEVLVTVDGGRE